MNVKAVCQWNFNLWLNSCREMTMSHGFSSTPVSIDTNPQTLHKFIFYEVKVLCIIYSWFEILIFYKLKRGGRASAEIFSTSSLCLYFCQFLCLAFILTPSSINLIWPLRVLRADSSHNFQIIHNNFRHLFQFWWSRSSLAWLNPFFHFGLCSSITASQTPMIID